MGKTLKLEDQLPVIHSMGNLIFDPIWAMNDHVSGNCELLHIISGSVTLVMNRQKTKAVAGDTLLIPCKARHRDEFDFAEGLKVFMIQFRWTCEKDFFSRISCKSLIGLPKTKKESIAALIQQFRCDFTEQNGRHEFPMRLQLSEILMKTLCLSEQNRKKSSLSVERNDTDKQHCDWIVSKVKAYLESNYSRPLSLDEIARHVNVSPYHLCHMFSSENDFTIFEYLTHIRMGKARSLLEEGRLSISEVAFSVGFNNSNYFSKVFHRFFGIPPAKMHRKRFPFRKA